MAYIGNPYIDDILYNSESTVIRDRMHREKATIHPAERYEVKKLENGQEYYTFSWTSGQVPAGIDFDIEVSSYANKRNPQSRSTPLHDHDFFEITYVYAGRVGITYETGKEMLLPGDINFCNLQTKHAVEFLTDDAVIFYLLIKPELFNQVFSTIIRDNELFAAFFFDSIYDRTSPPRHFTIHEPESPNCSRTVLHILDYYFKSEDMWYTAVKSLLVLLFINVARHLENGDSVLAPGKGESGRIMLREITAYIHDHYRSVTLDQLSDHFNYSSRSIARILHDRYNTTFMELAQSIRFTEACRLLTQTDEPIDRIAREMGYTNRSNFDRTFKLRYQMTPAEYRKG